MMYHSILLKDPFLKRKKWARHRSSVGSRNLVHECTFQDVVTKKLSLNMQLRIYQTCIRLLLHYRLETWPLLPTDTKRLQAFQMRCQHRILGVVWRDTVHNTRWLRQRVYHRSATSSAHIALHSSVMW